MPAPSAIRQNNRYSGGTSREIEIDRRGIKNRFQQRSQSRSRAIPLTRNPTPRYFTDARYDGQRSRSNDRRYDEYSRGDYRNDARDNDDYSSVGGSYADAASAIDEDEDKPGGFGFSAKFFCCDSTMSWGLSLGKEDEETEETEQLEESERNIKRGIIPHFPLRGRSLTRTDSFSRGRSFSRSKERGFRGHSRSRSLSGAIKGILRSTSYAGKRSASADAPRTRSWIERESDAHKVPPNQYEYFDDEYATTIGKLTDEEKSRRGSIKSSSNSTTSSKKSKGLFSKLSRKKFSNSKTALSDSRSYMPEGTDSKSLKSEDSDITKAEVDRLRSQLEDLKKAEEERRRQAELLEVAMNATNEEERRTFFEAATLASEAAAKALEDEETKRAAGVLLANQLEDERKSGPGQSEEEEEGIFPDTANSNGEDADANSMDGTESGSEDGGSGNSDDLTFDEDEDNGGENENPSKNKMNGGSVEAEKSKVSQVTGNIFIRFQTLACQTLA